MTSKMTINYQHNYSDRILHRPDVKMTMNYLQNYSARVLHPPEIHNDASLTPNYTLFVILKYATELDMSPRDLVLKMSKVAIYYHYRNDATEPRPLWVQDNISLSFYIWRTPPRHLRSNWLKNIDQGLLMIKTCQTPQIYLYPDYEATQNVMESRKLKIKYQETSIMIFSPRHSRKTRQNPHVSELGMNCHCKLQILCYCRVDTVFISPRLLMPFTTRMQYSREVKSVWNRVEFVQGGGWTLLLSCLPV